MCCAQPARPGIAGVLVDDRDDLDGPSVGGDVELEVHGPHPVGCIGDHGVRGSGGAVAFAAPPLWHPQPFLTPQPLNLLVIDDPAFPAGIVIGRTEPTARMVLGVGAQPGPQRGIGQQPFEGGVLPARDPSSVWRPRLSARRTGCASGDTSASETPSSRHTAAVSLPSASSLSCHQLAHDLLGAVPLFCRHDQPTGVRPCRPPTCEHPVR